MDIIDDIWSLLKDVWEYLKKVFVKVLNFFNNIVGWFKDPSRLKKLREDKNKVALAVKHNLSTGNYNEVVVGIFDKRTEEILVEDTVVYKAEELDEETLKHFGDKELIILK